MIRILLLVVSAFTALIAMATVVNGALISSASDASRWWMLGVILVGVLCWLRWRWQWHNVLLTPALIAGAVTLVALAASGTGRAVQLSLDPNVGPSARGIMDILLGAQAILMFSQLWMDRRHPSTIAEPPPADADRQS